MTETTDAGTYPTFAELLGREGRLAGTSWGLFLRTGPRNAVLHQRRTPSWRPGTASGPARYSAWTTRPTPSIPECHSNAARPATPSTPRTRHTGTTTWTDTTSRDPHRSTGSGTAGQTTSASTTAPRMTGSRKAPPDLGIQEWADNPIAGRGVLVDLDGYRTGQGDSHRPRQAENPSAST